MAFQFEPVKDRITEFPNGVLIDGNPAMLERNNGEIYEPGTPVNAALLNGMQQGIQDARRTYLRDRDPTAADNESTGVMAGDCWLNVTSEGALGDYWICRYSTGATSQWERIIYTTATPLPLNRGGTNATTAATARTNLGVPPTQHTSSTAGTYGAAGNGVWGHAKPAESSNPGELPGDAQNNAGVGGGNTNVFAKANHAHKFGSQIQHATLGHGILIGGDATYCMVRPTASNINTDLGSVNYRYRFVYLENQPNVSSDRREKKGIGDITEALALIMALRPQKYTMEKDPEGRLHYGLIGQEVRDAMEGLGVQKPDLWRRDSVVEDVPAEEATEDQVQYSLSYCELIAPLIAVAQEQQRRIEALEAAGG